MLTDKKFNFLLLCMETAFVGLMILVDLFQVSLFCDSVAPNINCVLLKTERNAILA